MLIHKPRPLPIKLARETFYLVFNRIKSISHKFIEPKGKGVKTYILNQAGQILLLRIGYTHQSWVLPGGSIDRGETPERAVKRELEEESGLSLDNLEFMFTKKHTEYKNVQLHYFFGRSSIGEIIIDDQEIVDGGWFDFDKLPEPRRPKLDMEINLLKEWLKTKQ